MKINYNITSFGYRIEPSSDVKNIMELTVLQNNYRKCSQIKDIRNSVEYRCRTRYYSHIRLNSQKCVISLRKVQQTYVNHQN